MGFISEVFEQVVSRQRDRVALIEDARQWTYGELDDEARRLASVIAEKVPGKNVGVLLLNSGKYIVSLLAIWKAGKTAVPLNYLLPPNELAFILQDSGTAAIISSQFFAQPLTAMKAMFGDRGTILMADDPALLSGVGASTASAYRDPALYLYTSGTTGRPKGVLLSHDNLLFNVSSCQKAGDFGEQDSFLCLLPFFHTYAITGTFLLPLLNGSKMVVVTDRFQALKVLKLIDEHRISVMLAIPSMYRVMAMTDGDFNVSHLRFPISGGEPLPVAVAEAFEKRFDVLIYEGYGQTEASPVISLNVPGHRRLGTVGRALSGVEVAIWDDNGQPVANGVVGEIVARGGSVMVGYHNLPEDTAKTVTNGWLHTGDLGKMDDDGFITITGRKKDLIISAGENIYPREVEEVLAQHPKVKEVAVIGVKDDVRGEVPKAFVILRDGETSDEKELRSFCRDHLANYKVPKHFQVVPDLPRTPSGKVLKRMLS